MITAILITKCFPKLLQSKGYSISMQKWQNSYSSSAKVYRVQRGAIVNYLVQGCSRVQWPISAFVCCVFVEDTPQDALKVQSNFLPRRKVVKWLSRGGTQRGTKGIWTSTQQCHQIVWLSQPDSSQTQKQQQIKVTLPWVGQGKGGWIPSLLVHLSKSCTLGTEAKQFCT